MEQNAINFAKQTVADFYNSRRGPEDTALFSEDVFVVWFCYTLGNWKALLSAPLLVGEHYYEVTHSGERGETYLDAYEKRENVRVQ